jgi:hypothetical protein
MGFVEIFVLVGYCATSFGLLMTISDSISVGASRVKMYKKIFFDR